MQASVKMLRFIQLHRFKPPGANFFYVCSTSAAVPSYECKLMFFGNAQLNRRPIKFQANKTRLSSVSEAGDSFFSEQANLAGIFKANGGSVRVRDGLPFHQAFRAFKGISYRFH
jgi:lipopolysaccharide export system protein LptA